MSVMKADNDESVPHFPRSENECTAPRGALFVVAVRQNEHLETNVCGVME